MFGERKIWIAVEWVMRLQIVRKMEHWIKDRWWSLIQSIRQERSPKKELHWNIVRRRKELSAAHTPMVKKEPRSADSIFRQHSNSFLSFLSCSLFCYLVRDNLHSRQTFIVERVLPKKKKFFLLLSSVMKRKESVSLRHSPSTGHPSKLIAKRESYILAHCYYYPRSSAFLYIPFVCRQCIRTSLVTFHVRLFSTVYLLTLFFFFFCCWTSIRTLLL